MNRLHQLLNERAIVNKLGAKVHANVEDSFQLVVGFVAGQQAGGYATRASEVQEYMGLGYLRTNQLLNALVEANALRRSVNGNGTTGRGCGWKYTLGRL